MRRTIAFILILGILATGVVLEYVWLTRFVDSYVVQVEAFDTQLLNSQQLVTALQPDCCPCPTAQQENNINSETSGFANSNLNNTQNQQTIDGIFATLSAQATTLENRFLRRSKALEMLISHNCIKEIRVHLAQVNASLSAQKIEEAIIFNAATLAYLYHLQDNSREKLRHIL